VVSDCLDYKPELINTMLSYNGPIFHEFHRHLEPGDPQEATDAVAQTDPPEVTDSAGYESIQEYQPGFNTEGQVGGDAVSETEVVMESPSSSPTNWLFPEPTSEPWDDAITPTGQSALAYSTSISPSTQAITWGSVTDISEQGITTDSSEHTPPIKPLNSPPELTVIDGNGHTINSFGSSGNSGGEGGDGMSSGAKIGVILLVLLGIAIACTSLLLIRRLRGRHNGQGRAGREFFFMKFKRVQPSDETETYDKTFVENNGSIASEEIDFHGPLFESWPMTKDDLDRAGSPRSRLSQPGLDDATLRGNDDEEQEQPPTDFSPYTYTSSLLSSFFSKVADGGDEVPTTESAADEIKRAINEGLWQDVYYLASKMAAEGNIDSNENLQTALVRSKESGGDYVPVKARAHLTQEDVARAAQLDVSFVAGDWITLAARAAVYAALDAANNPVPASISFIPHGKHQVDECLEKATAALKEARMAAEAKEEMRQRAITLSAEEDEAEPSVATEDKQMVFINADEDDSKNGFEYPRADYSDFSRTNSIDETNPESKEVSAPPSRQEPRPLVEDVADDGSCDEKSLTSDSRSDIPGPPSISMSNQSTIPTQHSTSEEVPFQSIAEAARGPFVRDFVNGISRLMEQEEEAELPMDLSKAIM
jgi:hypothetical protein